MTTLFSALGLLVLGLMGATPAPTPHWTARITAPAGAPLACLWRTSQGPAHWRTWRLATGSTTLSLGYGAHAMIGCGDTANPRQYVGVLLLRDGRPVPGARRIDGRSRFAAPTSRETP